MIDARNSKLFDLFSKLKLNSSKSVQDGQQLSALDEYLHVERPIERTLISKMELIDKEEGGIILLVGSAGDGKSHLLSRIKTKFNWSKESFYNDATASYSPNKTAVQTLREMLVDFCDTSIESTGRKLVLAINLGKLSAFIEDDEAQKKYSKICEAVKNIFDENCVVDGESNRIKIVRFDREQNYEILPNKNDDYPVKSSFMSGILRKITDQSNENPFYSAYLSDKEKEGFSVHPIVLNYEFLLSQNIQHTIVNTIIEASIRFKLIITPREYLDAIYNIVISKSIELNHSFLFCDSLLPNLLYNGGDNQILKSISKLDPLAYSNLSHDRLVSRFITSYELPQEIRDKALDAHVPQYVLDKINELYLNNGRNLNEISRLLLRLCHSIDYHSDSDMFKKFIVLFSKAIVKDGAALSELYDMVTKAIPRHSGLFYSREDYIPLDIQGGLFKLFSYYKLKPVLTDSGFDPNFPSRFNPYLLLQWENHPRNYSLKFDFQVFSYLYNLNDGRLVSEFNNERCLPFTALMRDISKSIGHDEIIIIDENGHETKLKQSFGKVRIS